MKGTLAAARVESGGRSHARAHARRGVARGLLTPVAASRSLQCMQVYTTYARSHLYYAAELVLLLVLLALVGVQVRARRGAGGWARGVGASLRHVHSCPSTSSLTPLPDPPHPHPQSYPSLTWSTWMVAVAILWAPFWFNPSCFQLEKAKEDFEAWLLWMSDVVDAETGGTWCARAVGRGGLWWVRACLRA